VTVFQKISAIWKEDNLLRRIVRNSSYLFGSNALSAILIFIQGILAVRLVGVAGWGLVAAIVTFASNINRLLSFRMSEVVVKHLAPALAAGKKREAAALVKAAALTEAATSLLAFVILALLAPWASRVFAKDIQTAPWFIFYGLILLSNIVYETSTGVLQAAHRFDRLARINLAQSAVTASIISGVFLLSQWTSAVSASAAIRHILLAYVLGKTYNGAAAAIAALGELGHALGPGWQRTPLAALPEKRAAALFALNTNLNGTVNLLFRDNIPLYLAALLSTTEVGYFKIAMTFILPLTLILDPFIAPTYAELARTIATAQWDVTRRLLRHITAITGGVALAFWGLLALTGWWLIPAIYTAQARPAYPLLLVLLLGYGFASIFQWNRSLLLSLGKSGYPVLVSTLAGLVEITLIFLLVPRYGHLMLAAILSGYFILSIGLIVTRGLLELRYRQPASEIVNRKS
jgi:O-antigen/teichoic acid export membrane protein